MSTIRPCASSAVTRTSRPPRNSVTVTSSTGIGRSRRNPESGNRMPIPLPVSMVRRSPFAASFTGPTFVVGPSVTLALGWSLPES